MLIMQKGEAFLAREYVEKNEKGFFIKINLLYLEKEERFKRILQCLVHTNFSGIKIICRE